MHRTAGYVVLAVALLGVGAVATRALRTPAPASESESQMPPPASVTPSPSAPAPLPLPRAIRYACRELSPHDEPVGSAETSPAATLQRQARWYGVSALDCADGLSLDDQSFRALHDAVSQLLAAAPKDLPVLGRALTQNAAMRVARCARAKEALGGTPVDASSIEALRRSSLRLVRRLALSEADIATLKELVRPAAETWLGAGFDERAVDGPRDFIGIHARASSRTLASRALPNDASGTATLWGDLVLITDRGVARTAGVPAYVLRRHTSETGLDVCFGAIAQDEKTGAPVIRHIGLPEGPLEVRGVTCDRCHRAGRRLSQPVPQPRSDEPLLEDVTRWYEGASHANQKRGAKTAGASVDAR